jgi:hypothetical protein
MTRTATDEGVRAIRQGIGRRLKILQRQNFGEHGSRDMADALEVPHSSWEKYLRGQRMPAQVCLRLMTRYHVEPSWLLRGNGPTYRITPIRIRVVHSAP